MALGLYFMASLYCQPVTWSGLALAGVVSSGVVYYYYSEKDRLQTQCAYSRRSCVLLIAKTGD